MNDCFSGKPLTMAQKTGLAGIGLFVVEKRIVAPLATSVATVGMGSTPGTCILALSVPLFMEKLGQSFNGTEAKVC